MIYLLVFITVATGLYMIIAHKMNFPPHSTAKAVRRAVAVKSNIMSVINKRFVMPIIKRISPIIRIESYKEKRLDIQLKRAEIDMTPKEYYARSIVMAVLAFVFGMLIVVFGAGAMLPVVVILSIVVYYHFFSEVNDKLKQKDNMIEEELPKFIRAIVQGLKNGENDIIKLLESYGNIAKKGLEYDIEVLIMDLKSGNFEDAMIDFEKRVGNAYVSRLSKVLIAVNRGDNQDSTLSHLLTDMALLARESMQRELNKRPGKVKMMVIPIVIVGVITLFYVIAIHLFNSVGGLM